MSKQCPRCLGTDYPLIGTKHVCNECGTTQPPEVEHVISLPDGLRKVIRSYKPTRLIVTNKYTDVFTHRFVILDEDDNEMIPADSQALMDVALQEAIGPVRGIAYISRNTLYWQPSNTRQRRKTS